MVAIAQYLQSLLDAAAAWFREEAVAEADRRLELVLDMRYVGQNFELPVVAGESAALRETSFRLSAERLHELFFAAHEQAYGYHNPQDPVEIANLRLTAWGRLTLPEAAKLREASGAPAAVGERLVHFEAEQPVASAVYHRHDLRPGHRITGPAVIEQLDSTSLVYPGDTARVDPALNLIIDVRP